MSTYEFIALTVSAAAMGCLAVRAVRDDRDAWPGMPFLLAAVALALPALQFITDHYK